MTIIRSPKTAVVCPCNCSSHSCYSWQATKHSDQCRHLTARDESRLRRCMQWGNGLRKHRVFWLARFPFRCPRRLVLWRYRKQFVWRQSKHATFTCLKKNFLWLTANSFPLRGWQAISALTWRFLVGFLDKLYNLGTFGLECFYRKRHWIRPFPLEQSNCLWSPEIIFNFFSI